MCDGKNTDKAGRTEETKLRVQTGETVLNCTVRGCQREKCIRLHCSLSHQTTELLHQIDPFLRGGLQQFAWPERPLKHLNGKMSDKVASTNSSKSLLYKSRLEAGFCRHIMHLWRRQDNYLNRQGQAFIYACFNCSNSHICNDQLLDEDPCLGSLI